MHQQTAFIDRGEIRRICLLAFPLILSNLTQPMLASVDTILSGHQKSAAVLGGVAMGGVLFNTIFWSFGFLRMATTGLVAQAWGARRPGDLCAHVLRALGLGLAIGLAILALQKPLIHFALGLLGGSNEVHAQALVYCSIRIWAAPATLINYAVLGTLLGRQQSRTALLLQASIQAVNLVLALWLVSGLHWGIAGIATATLSAEWFGCLLGLALLGLQINWHSVEWNHLLHAEQLLHLFRLNRDILVRTLALVAAFAWFTRCGAQAGDAVLAANAVLLNLLSIASYALDGFGNVTEALTGEALGARNRAQLVQVLRASFVCALLTAVLLSLFFVLMGTHIIGWFTNQPAVAHEATLYLPWLMLLPMVAVWGYQFDGIFIGATRSTDLRNSMLISLSLFLALSLLLVHLWGNHGLWLAFTCFMALRGLTLGLRVKAIPQLIA
ncbi:MATE family efflux transporter [Telmatobacter bradus]|uniref:MATE family efflux transporter n=1 Tax=Telmatobacter bradus TaxID=474953 RepID=UPI003B427E0B